MPIVSLEDEGATVANEARCTCMARVSMFPLGISQALRDGGRRQGVHLCTRQVTRDPPGVAGLASSTH